MSGLIAQIRHDFLIEYRNWPQVLALLLFMWTLAYVIYRIRPEISPQEFNFIFWIFILLVSVNVAIRSESHNGESERIMRYTLVSPSLVLASRIIFNILYLLLIALTFYASILLFFYPQITLNWEYLVLVSIGAIAIGSVMAFVAAISRHVSGQNTALSILAIPPLILVVITLNSIGGNLLMNNQLQGSKYLILLGIILLTIALSMLLYPFIWRE